MEKKDEIIEVYNEDDIAVTSVKVGGLIHIIRGKQVILDSDLAMLYQVDTGALNRAVKRNKKRFPDDFCFQLTEEELLRCQNGISKKDASEGRGGRRYMPYAFTEQGISMLSAILRSDVAINVSIGIMRAFVEMRKFLATNSLILNRIDDLEVKQLQYQKSTDKMSELARMIRFAVNDDYDTILYGGYDPTIVSSRVLEDDEITFYGTSVGLFSFLHALEPLRFYRAIERRMGLGMVGIGWLHSPDFTILFPETFKNIGF
jgi:hypothetical protein